MFFDQNQLEIKNGLQALKEFLKDLLKTKANFLELYQHLVPYSQLNFLVPFNR